MVTFLTVLLVLASLGMIVLVLLHKGKGGGLSNMFGGGVSSSLGGSAVVEKNLDRLTIVCGLVWFTCIIALGLLLKTPAPPEPAPGSGAGPSHPERHARTRTTRTTSRSTCGRRQRDPRQPRRRRPDGRGGAGRGRTASPDRLLVRQQARDPAVVRRRGGDPRDLGLPALRLPGRAGTRTHPPSPPKTEPYKTHLAYVRERRNQEDGEAILAEALAKLRGK